MIWGCSKEREWHSASQTHTHTHTHTHDEVQFVDSNIHEFTSLCCQHTEDDIMYAGARTVPCREHPHSLLASDLLQWWVSGCVGAIQCPFGPHCCSTAFHPLDHARRERALPGTASFSSTLHPIPPPCLSTWPPRSRGEDPPSWRPPAPFSPSQHALVLSLFPFSPEQNYFTSLSFLSSLQATGWLGVRFRETKFHHEENRTPLSLSLANFTHHLSKFFTGEHFPSYSPFL